MKVFTIYERGGHLGNCDLDHLYNLFTPSKEAPHERICTIKACNLP